MQSSKSQKKLLVSDLFLKKTLNKEKDISLVNITWSINKINEENTTREMAEEIKEEKKEAKIVNDEAINTYHNLQTKNKAMEKEKKTYKMIATKNLNRESLGSMEKSTSLKESKKGEKKEKETDKDRELQKCTLLKEKEINKNIENEKELTEKSLHKTTIGLKTPNKLLLDNNTNESSINIEKNINNNNISMNNDLKSTKKDNLNKSINNRKSLHKKSSNPLENPTTVYSEGKSLIRTKTVKNVVSNFNALENNLNIINNNTNAKNNIINNDTGAKNGRFSNNNFNTEKDKEKEKQKNNLKKQKTDTNLAKTLSSNLKQLKQDNNPNKMFKNSNNIKDDEGRNSLDLSKRDKNSFIGSNENDSNTDNVNNKSQVILNNLVSYISPLRYFKNIKDEKLYTRIVE